MCKGRCILEKSFLVLVAFLYFIQNARMVPVFSEFSKPPPCLNETCVHVANRILEAMDSNVNPCEDFYAYACNGWMKNHPISHEMPSWSVFDELQQRNDLLIKDYLDQPIDAFVSKAERKAKIFYESCLDRNKIREALGAKPMLKLLKELGGWSVSTANFDIKNWSLQDTLQIIQNKYGVNALFAYEASRDVEPNKYTMFLKPGTLILPERVYLNKTKYEIPVVNATLEYMIKVGFLLGGNPNYIRSQMEAVLKFDGELANILFRDFKSAVKFEDTVRTIDELQTVSGFINWQAFFENAMKIVSEDIISKEEIIVSSSQYLDKLSLVLRKYNQTKEGRIVLNNYLIWKIVNEYTPMLSKAFTDLNRDFTRIIYPEDHQNNIELTCVRKTAKFFDFVAGAILARQEFQPDLKTNIKEMLKGIKNSFKANLKNLEWLDEETRKAVEIKADAVTDRIGYPSFILDTDLLDKYYEFLTFKRETYFINFMNAISFNSKKNRDMRFNSTWGFLLSDVDAKYYYGRNQIAVSISILQRPFYHSQDPASSNFGAIGMVLGHELTHGFDDTGRNYDKNGNYQQWWNDRAIKLFHNRTNCLKQQYDQYEFGGIHVNGTKTLNENIADNGGLKTAYYAYLEYMKNKPDVQPLPGLNLNHKQLFFLAFAQAWCTNRLPIQINTQVNDEHPVNEYRVIGTLSNSNEFSKEFKCPLGSRMNPRKKCEVW